MGEKIAIRNLNEDFVELYVDECMEKRGMCTCEICTADVRAIALNQLPPHYVSTDVGDAMVRHVAQTTQGQADILAAIMEGVKVVEDNPRHK